MPRITWQLSCLGLPWFATNRLLDGALLGNYQLNKKRLGVQVIQYLSRPYPESPNRRSAFLSNSLNSWHSRFPGQMHLEPISRTVHLGLPYLSRKGILSVTLTFCRVRTELYSLVAFMGATSALLFESGLCEGLRPFASGFPKGVM